MPELDAPRLTLFERAVGEPGQGVYGVVGMKKICIVFVSLLLALAMLPAGSASAGGPPAAFTTVNEAVDGTGHCKNGNPGVNCNIYDGKDFVWLNGGPVNQNLGDGTYFFAVLSPGGQADPNDGTAKNLSDDFDAYTNRTLTSSGGTLSYGGTHDFSDNEIRLMPYADTSNPGGVYILAICSLADGYPVDPSKCKYDAFKVSQEEVIPPAADLAVTKNAAGSFKTTYAWQITKDADKTRVEQSGTTATFNYTVTVSHDNGTAGHWQVTGTITINNPNEFVVSGVVVSDQIFLTDDTTPDASANCVVAGSPATLPAASGATPGQATLSYTCSYSAAPAASTEHNRATINWPATPGNFLGSTADDLAAGSAFFIREFTFPSTPSDLVDECVNVTDTVGGTLGTACVADGTSKDFHYSRTVTGTAGTCKDFDNTATFTTNDLGLSGSAEKTVTLCVGANLTVTKTAATTFTRTYNWSILKSVDKTTITQLGHHATFNYTVAVNQTGFTDSAWVATGTITVKNPNDWESITTTVADATDIGGTCAITGNATVTLLAGAQADLPYTCTFSSAPSASTGTNTATATWDKDTAKTPDGSATGTATISFTTPTTTVNKTITVTDTFAGTLGTLTATDAQPFTSHNFTYSRTVDVPATGCLSYTNTAVIVETNQSSSVTVQACKAPTGALTMGFWQNKNGQAIITGANQTNLAAFLMGYNPFKDLTGAVNVYVTNVIKAANASGASMNAMLKGQMLATALDVYFSDPALGGNQINAPAPIGGITIDLTTVCANIPTCTTYVNSSSAFGGASSLTVSAMLSYSNIASNSGGTVWYANVKTTQELAKDAFDAINNQVAFGP